MKSRLGVILSGVLLTAACGEGLPAPDAAPGGRWEQRLAAPVSFLLQTASNDWWMEARVTASPAPSRVDVSVNGGAWTALSQAGWDVTVWTRSQSFAGSRVRVRAVNPGGTATSCEALFQPGAVLSLCASDGVYATEPAPDAGVDAGTDAGVDAGTDAGVDAGTDGGTSNPPGAAGYLHTEGASLYTSTGQKVRLTSVNWFGFEGPSRIPYGLDRRALGSLLDQVKALGYNSLRLPYSNSVLRAGVYPDAAYLNTSLNPGLAGLTSLQVMDRIIDAAGTRGLRVVLDRHRPDASSQSELWYRSNRAAEEQAWIDDWKMLAQRYKGNATVVGVDLHNEPHGRATWGDGNLDTDWRLAAERAGNAILGVNPDLLIIVEGIETYANNWYWWGGNLRGARDFPVRLNVAGRLVYSAHDYPESVYAQPWFQNKGATGYPANLPALWDATWGYLVKENRAPVWLGEFGTKLQLDSDRLWLQTLTGYLSNNGMSFAFWSLNPNSDDTGGLLQDDWTTVQQAKQTLIAPALAPLIP
ncbi:endoglucanase [Stigmatella aurantiaca]|uniref:cellulase n=1 Tax=Stigmatella aurantiaca TaxID=41 RepID=A0A1H7HZJ6_STIAU|nr:endoglucanase [Stigmatella aurantiaca]